MTVGFAGSTVTVRFENTAFEVDHARPAAPAWFGLGIRKSGSSMFNRALKLMAKFNAVNWVDIPGDLFLNNVSVPQWRESLPPPGLLAGGNLYGGYRDYPSGLATSPVFRDGIKVLLVRDPRDAIVSEYFSTRATHSLPESTGEDGAREDMLRRREAAQQTGIEDYARAEAFKMADTVERFIAVRDDPKLLLLRCEDVIFDKARMVQDVIDHFGWTIQPAQIEAILKWIDVVPERENPGAFIRKVTPGDHKEKLSPAVIAEMNSVLAPTMTAFGYS